MQFIILGAIIVLVLAIILLLKTVNKNKVANAAKSGKTDLCSSMDCVRCSAYETLLKSVQIKLNAFLIQSPSEAENIERLCTSVSSRFREKVTREWKLSGSTQQPHVLYLQGLTAKPWHSDMYMSEQNILRKNFAEILSEFQRVEEFDCGWTTNRVPTGSWHVFHLINQGKVVEDNSSRCPQTLRILRSLESIMTENVFGNVFFSVLDPGTSIEEHCGPTNIRLRIHLGLQVPYGCVQLTVNYIPTEWVEGETLVFDDSFIHSVKHTGSLDLTCTRAVLIADLWHPQVTLAERSAINYMFSSRQNSGSIATTDNS